MVSGWRGQTAVILYRKRSPRSATLVARKSPDSKPLETFLTIKNYEEVDVYPLDDDLREEILRKQIECTFIWGPKTGWPVGVLMTYVWRDGRFWVTATSQRKRIRAIKRDPRVSVVVSSHGTDLGPAKGITAKGRAIIHEDDETKAWFYPLCAAANVPVEGKLRNAFEQMLHSERRLVIEIVPEKWITFDAGKMMVDSMAAWKEMGLLD
jgi:hypothetical protein